MKTRFKMTALAVLLMGSSTLRADVSDLIPLALYADQLLNQGIYGPRFVQLVDDRYWGLYPYGRPPGPGMGAFVQQMHAQGLYGHALANAIHNEQARRGIANWRGGSKPIPPGQLKKMNPVISPRVVLIKPEKAKPKFKFPGGGPPGHSHGKGKKK